MKLLLLGKFGFHLELYPQEHGSWTHHTSALWGYIYLGLNFKGDAQIVCVPYRGC